MRIEEGLYFDDSNEFVKSVVDHWPEEYRIYNQQVGATPWLPTGDSRTGLPFLLNKLEDPKKFRMFVKTEDDEYVALDMAFPTSGHNFSRPLYFVLHGLNGGSNDALTARHARKVEGTRLTCLFVVALSLQKLLPNQQRMHQNC